jgi:hypothetical protein
MSKEINRLHSETVAKLDFEDFSLTEAKKGEAHKKAIA